MARFRRVAAEQHQRRGAQRRRGRGPHDDQRDEHKFVGGCDERHRQKGDAGNRGCDGDDAADAPDDARSAVCPEPAAQSHTAKMSWSITRIHGTSERSIPASAASRGK